MNVRRKRALKNVAVVAGAALVLPVSEVLAQQSGSTPRNTEFEYRLTAGLQRSDNNGRTSANEESDTIASVGGGFDFERASPLLDIAASGNATYLDYLDNTFGNETLAFFEGSATWHVIGDSLTWDFADSYGQVTVDPRAPITPSNREDANFFTTGPTFLYPVSSQLDIGARAQFTHASFETSETDSSGYGGSLVALRRLSPSRTREFVAGTQKTEYQDVSDADFTRNQVVARLASRPRRSDLTFEVGYNEIDGDRGDADGFLISGELSRELTARTSISVKVGQELTDAANRFADIATGNVQSSRTTDATLDVDPFEVRYIDLGATYVNQRSRFSVGVSLEEQSYINDDTQDRERTEITARYSRELSPKLVIGANASLQDDEFKGVNDEFNELRIGVDLSWQLTRLWSANFFVRRDDRDSESGSVTGGDVVDNVVGVSFTYSR